MVVTWRDDDFDEVLELLTDREQDPVFRASALSMLPDHLACPLPAWLMGFSAVVQLRDFFRREGTGDEPTRLRWQRITDLVIDQVLGESEDITEPMKGGLGFVSIQGKIRQTICIMEL